MNHTPLKLGTQPPVSGTSSGAVESEPVRKIDSVEIQEVVEHSIKDPQVSAHVEAREEVPNIVPDLARQGVRTDAAVKFPTYHTVKLPLSQNKIPPAMKQPVHESVRWLGTLSYYIMEQTKYKFTKSHESAYRFLRRILSREMGRFD